MVDNPLCNIRQLRELCIAQEKLSRTIWFDQRAGVNPGDSSVEANPGN